MQAVERWEEEQIAASFLEKLITRPYVADLISLGEGDAEIFDLTVPNNKIVGKTIGEVSPTKDYIIIATYEKDNIIIPQPKMRLEFGSKITILVKRGKFKIVSKKFES